MSDEQTMRSRSQDTDAFWDSAAAPRLAQFTETDDVPSTSVGETIKNLDDEERSVQRIIRALHSRRNALAAISRLHTEIIIHIFSLLAASDCADKDGGKAPSGDHRLGWIRVTHVCQRWRNLALACPNLWGVMDFALGEKWAATISRRWTRPVPLSIYVSRVLSPRETHFIGTQIQHVQSLRLHQPSGSPFYGLLHSLLPPASLAEATGTVPPRLDRSATRPNNPTLRHVLISAVFPALWSSPFLNNVVTLHLVDETRRSRWTAQLDDVLSALARMPALESVELRGCMPVARPPTATSDRTVSLPSLTRLCIEGGMESCGGLLRRLHAPACAVLHINPLCRRAVNAPYGAFLDDTAAFLGRRAAFAPAAMRVLGPQEIGAEWDISDIEILKVEAWRALDGDAGLVVADKDVVAKEAAADVVFLFEWRFEGPGDGLQDGEWDERVVARGCYRTFASPHLRQFVIQGNGWDQAAWRAAMPLSPGLRRIVAWAHDGVALLHALLAVEETRAEAGEYLPALDSLFLSCVKDIPWERTLAPWLAARQRAGYPMKNMVLDSCRLPPLNRPFHPEDTLKAAAPGMTLQVTGDPVPSEDEEQFLVSFQAALQQV